MRSYFLTALAITLMVAHSCAIRYDIVSNKEESINFSTYKTYAIIHDDHGFEIGANSVQKESIDRAVTSEIEEIGYVQSANADLQINWFIKIDTKLEPGIYNAYYSMWRYPNAIDVYEYQEGSLVIDLVDTKSGQVVWHVKVSSKISEDMLDVENKIKEVIKEVFKSYKKDTGITKIIRYALK